MADIPPPTEIRPVIESTLPKAESVRVPKKVDVESKPDIPGHIGLAEPIEADSKQILSSEKERRVVEVFRIEDDDLFKSRLGEVKENPPHSVEVINNEHTGSHQEKFEHTFRNLNRLDTAGLTTEEKFVARTSMLLHDCLPQNALDDLDQMVKQGLITYPEAYRISQHVWWHDFLGSENSDNRKYFQDIKSVIRNPSDQEINKRIFVADITDYGFLDIYKDTLAGLNGLEAPHDDYLSPEDVWQANKVDKTKVRFPKEGEVFVHGIFVNRGDGDLGEVTKKSLVNMFASGALRSGALNSGLERAKIGLREPNFSDKLNVSRIDPGEGVTSNLDYSKGDSLISLVVLGKDVKQDCLVCPISQNERDSISDRYPLKCTQCLYN